MDTLVFVPMYFYCVSGNVGNMAVTRKRPYCQGANMCYFVSYWLEKETLQTLFANSSNKNVDIWYLLYSNKWGIATMFFARCIIMVYDWRFMRWRHLLKQHLMPLYLIT